MGLFDDIAKSKQEEKEREAKRKVEEQEKMAEEQEKIADDRSAINKVLIERKFGLPKYYIDGISAFLWVYPDKIILDRAKGGILNLFNHTIKIIPMKNIKTLQFKNPGGPAPGYIEFGVNGSDAPIKEMIDNDNENRFMYYNAQNAIDAYFYMIEKIS